MIVHQKQRMNIAERKSDTECRPYPFVASKRQEMPKKLENSSTSVKTVGCFFERLDQPFWGKCRRPKDEGQKEGQKRNHLRRRPKAAWLIHGVDSLGYTNKGHWSWSLNFPSTFSGNRSSLCCYLHEFPAWFAPSNIYIYGSTVFSSSKSIFVVTKTGICAADFVLYSQSSSC